MTTKKLANLTENQKAYLAGFLDGDGSIYARIVKRKDYVLRFQLTLSVAFFQKKTQKHILLQFQKEIGAGIFIERKDLMCELILNGHSLVEPFLRSLVPFLRVKKKQANLILKICELLPTHKKNPIKFLELCELADQIANLNYSKNREVTAEVVKDHFFKLEKNKDVPVETQIK